MLATCRRHQNHGKFNGSIEEELRVLDEAVSAGAQAVDVEIESAEMAAAKLGLFRGRARLIVSYHNYEATPQLDTLLNRMTQIPADGYKVVTTARKPSDYGRVLTLAKVASAHADDRAGDGRTGISQPRAFHGIRRHVHICRAHYYARARRPDKFARASCGTSTVWTSYRARAKIYGVVADPVRHSISPGGAQPRLPIPAH